jgi:hypothetical protein
MKKQETREPKKTTGQNTPPVEVHTGNTPDSNTHDPITDEPIDEISEADLTKEDLEALGPRDLSMDLGDDEQLKHREHGVHFSADDLDIPGAELDDENEMIGSEDEENNAYSLGGDNHEDLEEDPS